MTFSIVARDPQTGECGVAVQSRFMAIGALTPWARAGVGAIATQAWINTVYGSRGLALLASGVTSAETIQAIAQAFEKTEGPLWDRLITALSEGQAAGGDRRGQQSAALLVVREHGGFRGFNDRVIDLRVDDHPHPIDELQRILRARLADPVWSSRE